MSIKGISPLVATVLLIAFTMAIATLLSLWLSSFTTKTSETVEKEAEKQLACSRGGVSLSDLRFNSTYNWLSGRIENTRSIALGDHSLQIVYTNFSTQKIGLCLSGSTTVACSVSNLTLSPGELSYFNVSISSNYDKIRVNTNCSQYGVYDEVPASEVL